MARVNKFEITKYKNIYSLKTSDNKMEFYTTFMLDGITYQKKNLTKLFDATTAKLASDELEGIKRDLRKGIDPFSKSSSDKVKDIIAKHIEDKKSKNNSKTNDNYKRNLTNFYNMYIHPVIGHLKTENVRREHVNKILISIEGKSKSYKLNLHVLMFSIFEKEFRAGNIKNNPFYEIDYGNHKPKAPFDIRLNEPMESVAIKIYKKSLTFSTTHRLILLMSIMLARRVGELFQLKFSHIKKYSDGEWYVIATDDITKTSIEEKYPLPEEVIELLPENILDKEFANEQLFTFCYSGIFKKEHDLVKDAKIKLNDNHKITSHDNRYLFLSILSSLGVDSDLADRCLSHSNQSNIKQIYLDVPYTKRKSIFETWWKFLREQ